MGVHLTFLTGHMALVNQPGRFVGKLADYFSKPTNYFSSPWEPGFGPARALPAPLAPTETARSARSLARPRSAKN